MQQTGLLNLCTRAFNLGVSTCLLLLMPQISWAAGTTSGTAINNSATLSYTIGAGPAATATSNTVSFTVDDKVNVLVAGGIQKSVSPGQTSALTPFTVTNLGNATQGYDLFAANAVSGAYTVNATAITDNFDPAPALRICLDDGAGVPADAGDGILSAAELAACPVAPGVTRINTLAPNATAYLVVLTDIPSSGFGSNIGDAAVVSLKASTLWPTPLVPAEVLNLSPIAAAQGAPVTPALYPPAANTAGVDVVFADAAGAIAGDIASDGIHSTLGAYLVNGVNVAVTKTVPVVLDPTGTTPNGVLMPGSVMTYQIAVALTGSGTASNLVITDPLPANTTYVTSSIAIACNSGIYSGGGACGVGTISTPQPPVGKNDGNVDGDYADFNLTTPNTVTVTLGNVTSPANFVITFKATIN